MPLGITRLNVRKTPPNANINFIKPLPGPDTQTSQEFLERIAAQCLPVMRAHHLYVMSLEEFPPNREFVGRNFNAGEVIQLVLKAPGSGRWLPFEYVQMVMMHELAHCKQMNHSRAFWTVRNGYAGEMRALWARGYTGDGLWGRGAELATGRPWEGNVIMDTQGLPEHLCGGTYRSRRGRKRKTTALSYQERKERRIRNKFGVNGVALGADDEVKTKLEKGKKVQGKPRVAGSARGRELRAAAALARFGQQKKEDVKDEGEEEASSGSDYEDDEEGGGPAAVDVNGARLVDPRGRAMVKVCEDEEVAGDPEARDELAELRDVFSGVKREPRPSSPEVGLSSMPAIKREPQREASPGVRLASIPAVKREPKRDATPEVALSSIPAAPAKQPNRPPARVKQEPDKAPHTRAEPPRATSTGAREKTTDRPAKHNPPPSAVRTCPLCSYANPPAAVTCAMCANVVDSTAAQTGWQCGSEACRAAGYTNSRDCGVCGLCGQRRG